MNVIKIQKEEQKSSLLKMPNNLDVMIRRSGLLNREVAERKGIRPETVSRHISGALQFNLKDAEEYAIILGCTAQDVLFAQHPVILFGELNNDVVKVRSPIEKQIGYYLQFPVQQDLRIVKANHTNENKRWANGRMYGFSNLCIEKECIDTNCFMRLSIMLIKNDTSVRFGVTYPEPGGTFSVGFDANSHSQSKQPTSRTVSKKDIKRGLELTWATPILFCIMQPDLMDVVEKN